MRTLRQIDNDVFGAAKARAAELVDTPTGDLMTENEIIAIQAQIRYGDLYHDMYHTLAAVEEYLKSQGTPSPQVEALLKRISEI